MAEADLVVSCPHSPTESDKGREGRTPLGYDSSEMTGSKG